MKFRVNPYLKCSKKHSRDGHGISVTKAYSRIELRCLLRVFLFIKSYWPFRLPTRIWDSLWKRFWIRQRSSIIVSNQVPAYMYRNMFSRTPLFMATGFPSSSSRPASPPSPARLCILSRNSASSCAWVFFFSVSGLIGESGWVELCCYRPSAKILNSDLEWLPRTFSEHLQSFLLQTLVAVNLRLNGRMQFVEF